MDSQPPHPMIFMITILIDSLNLSARVMRWWWMGWPTVVIVIGVLRALRGV